MHLVAQSGRSCLEPRLVDGGDERSAQLLRGDRLELGQRPGAEAVLDAELCVLELVEAEGRDERGHAGAEGSGARASAAVVDDRRHLGEEPLVRDAAGDEHVLCRPRRHLGRVGLGGVELVEAETEELAAA
eukprot:scaffold59487_cov39-Phaeocystis_antarctica.AAC.1